MDAHHSHRTWVPNYWNGLHQRMVQRSRAKNKTRLLMQTNKAIDSDQNTVGLPLLLPPHRTTCQPAGRSSRVPVSVKFPLAIFQVCQLQSALTLIALHSHYIVEVNLCPNQSVVSLLWICFVHRWWVTDRRHRPHFCAMLIRTSSFV